MEKKVQPLRLKQIRPAPTRYRFSYDVDYEVKLMPGHFARSSQEDIPPSVTGQLTVRVNFSHGKMQRHPRIEKIEETAKKEIRELLPNLIKQITS